MPSTAIRSFYYDNEARQLFVTFVTGRKYVYDDVPADVHEAFRAASSRGGFFNTNIRGHYDFREITSPPIKETARRHTASDRRTASRR